MKHSIRHDLDLPTARKVADAALASYQTRFAKYEPTATWPNDKQAEIEFKVRGIKLKGSLRLQPNEIGMNLDVPLLFQVFKKQAVGVIEQEIQKWIAKAKAGEL